MLRYALPLIAVAAVTAALFLAELPISPACRLLGAAFLCVLPLMASLAQVRILLREHTANAAARWIQSHVAPGSRVGQIWPEVPPLDSRRYHLRALHGLFAGDPPGPEDLDRDLLILDNLPIVPFSGEFLGRLARDYFLAAEFRAEPRVGPWVWEEQDAPHDWKYTHPILRIYRKR